MSLKKKEISINDLNKYKIDYDLSSELDLTNYKVLISDWLGIIYE